MSHKKWFFFSIVFLSLLACFPVDFFQTRFEQDMANLEERSPMELPMNCNVKGKSQNS